MPETKVDEGKQDVDEIHPGKEGEYPESVSWKQYVGIKESFGKKLESEKQRAASLEEQLKKAVSAEEYARLTAELGAAQTEAKKAKDELKNLQDSSLKGKRETLVKKGVPEEEVKDLTDRELDIYLKALGASKPKPDMGTGGGSLRILPKNPLELATVAYEERSRK